MSIAWPVWQLKLWKTDLSIPFSYGQDSLFYGVIIKGMIQNGWYWQNPYVGMPYGLNFLDFPRSDNLHLILLKAISLIFPHYGVTMNLFYLLGFPLAAITSLYVFRHFKMSSLPAFLGSLLYTFLPYHFFRNVQHLFLSAYYLVPLTIMVVLWVATEPGSLADLKNEGRFFPRLRKIPHFWAAIIICLLVSSAGIYYSYFAAFFLIVAGVLAAAQRKKLGPAIVAGGLVAIILFGTIMNIAPSLYHQYNHGKNPEVGNRTYFQAEIYGLKISQLLLPIRWHRLAALSDLREGYSANAPLVNENDCASLGFVGSIGFLLLVGAIFCHRLRAWDPKISPLCRLNLAGLLLATIGGFSTLVAIFFPYMRGYNRISVYLAYFALFTISLVIDKWLKKPAGGSRKMLYSGLFIFVLGLGILDQSSPSFFPSQAVDKISYYQQAQFIEKIESSMPSRAMIYQLPYVPFPENPPVHRMQDYDHFGGGYLFSRELRWSYGVMRNREGDSWQRFIALRPVSEVLERITLAGFQGLFIDRYGYEDHGVRLENEIRDILGSQPIETPNQRYAFYSLLKFAEGLKKQFPEREWEKRKEMAIYPCISWLRGFSHLEGTPENNWRWCSHEGVLSFQNHSPGPREIGIAMTLATGYQEYAEINISGDLISENLMVNLQGTLLKKNIIVPPGEHRIRFSAKAKRVPAPADLRTLVFRVNNFRFQEVE